MQVDSYLVYKWKRIQLLNLNEVFENSYLNSNYLLALD